jgi:spore coat polysaccharide biosynthesis protein SpsF
VIAAIIQARMGSTRLPEKVMMDLQGRPVLWHVIERVKHATRVDYVIVATTMDTSDDIIKHQCTRWGVPVFRGPVDDVLARFYKTVRFIESGVGPVNKIVRITSDCPLIDPQIIDSVVGDAISGNYDYVSNVDPPTFPDGFDVEVFTVEALEEAFCKAILSSEREHVTPYIRNNPRFRKFNHINAVDLSKMRLTLDTDKDFQVISKIFQALYQPGGIFYLEDIVTFLGKEKSLLEINAVYGRNEGYQKSLEHDHMI